MNGGVWWFCCWLEAYVLGLLCTTISPIAGEWERILPVVWDFVAQPAYLLFRCMWDSALIEVNAAQL